MSTLVWQAAGSAAVNKIIMDFMAGEDVVLDRVLLPFDIQATAAHVSGLGRIGILNDAEVKILLKGLAQLAREFADGQFSLDDRFEDGHSAIEYYLTEYAGELGGKVHTGRSRNDQVLVASRLFLRSCLLKLAELNGQIAQACLDRAEEEKHTPMPGYTHLQRAVPSSVGMWMGGFAEAFTDNLSFAAATYRIIDCNPLGTAAGYGVNLPLDRDFTTEELAFSRLQINPVAAQNSRGKFEIMALQAASHSMQDVRRLAWDLSVYTTSEFDLVRLPDSFTTGSSIMPNKSNPDVVELLRGSVAVVDSAIHEIQSVISLPSGYHRDLQLTKPPMIRGMQTALRALSIVPQLVDGLSFQTENMRKSISNEMFATDLAIRNAAAGIPFREAYLKAKEELINSNGINAEESLAQRLSPGASGDLRLDGIERHLSLETDMFLALRGDS
jgi:argininosuccinate lyase